MDLGVIVAVGARTPLSLDAAQTGFAIRAGAMAMREAPLVDADGEPITMCFVPTLDPLLTGARRGAALARPALAEALDGLRTTATDLRVRTALCIDEGLERQDGGMLTAEIDGSVKTIFPNSELEVFARGPAGAGHALPGVVEQLAAGRIDLAILGGVHTDYDPGRIASLDARGRLFHPPDNLSAVLPGEAAAFVVLALPGTARRMGLASLAALRGVAQGFEQARPDNDVSAFRATGLTAAMRSVLAPIAQENQRVGWVLTDLGFETYRHFELQAALTRTQSYMGEPQHVDSPAQRIGYLGAAAMPLHLVLGAEAFRRGYAPDRWLLSVAGSDGGERAVILLARSI